MRGTLRRPRRARAPRGVTYIGAVEVGRGARFGRYVVVGEPPAGARPADGRTVIGGDAVIRSHTVI